MQTIITILCLALLMWVRPASAQSTYSLKVSHHRNIALTTQEVDRILADASKLLKKQSGHLNPPDNVACNVTFTRDGPITAFASPDTPQIVDENSIDAVHRENSDGHSPVVKVVKEIKFCKGHSDDPSHPNPIWGCSWPHHWRSIIVAYNAPFPDILWAHEFGHLTGLWHRSEPQALMTACALTPDQVQVNRNECSCFLGGPGSCSTPPVAPACAR